MARVHYNGYPNRTRTLLVTPGNPGVGVEFSYVIPMGTGFLLEALTLTLTTSATVATRNMRWRIMRGGSAVGSGIAASTTAASNGGFTCHYMKAIQANAIASASNLWPMPVLPPLKTGDVIETYTSNFQAGDAYSGAVLVFSVLQ